MDPLHLRGAGSVVALDPVGERADSRGEVRTDHDDVVVVVVRHGIAGLGELAAQEGVSGSYASRLVRLAFLAPDIPAAIMDGRRPAELSAAALLQECRSGLPVDWQQQRNALGFR